MKNSFLVQAQDSFQSLGVVWQAVGLLHASKPHLTEKVWRVEASGLRFGWNLSLHVAPGRYEDFVSTGIDRVKRAKELRQHES